MKRNIIHIDESKCTGCGLCVPNCAEGSLEIRNGKAILVGDALCDGLGACLGHCPEGALRVEERDAEEFDETAVEHRLAELSTEQAREAAGQHEASSGGCPSARATVIERRQGEGRGARIRQPSTLGQWPVQLALLPPTAPYFKGSELVLSADCVPFAYANFHEDLLNGCALAVACPKLDNADSHFQKLVEIFRQGGLTGITLVRMEVPCCGGLAAIATKAMEESGANLPIREVIVSRDGMVLNSRPLRSAA